MFSQPRLEKTRHPKQPSFRNSIITLSLKKHCVFHKVILSSISVRPMSMCCLITCCQLSFLLTKIMKLNEMKDYRHKTTTENCVVLLQKHLFSHIQQGHIGQKSTRFLGKKNFRISAKKLRSNQFSISKISCIWM